MVLETNPSAFLFRTDFLLTTVFDEVLDSGLVPGEDALYRLLSGDILNLSAAKLELIGQISRIGVRDIGHHRLPNLAFDFERWLIKAYFVEESPFKGLIQILGQVSGSDEDSVQILHFLKDYVLNGVLHLVNRSFRPLLTNTEDSVGFIEEKNGNGAAFSYACAILIEDILDVLLAFPNPAALDLRHVNDEEVASAFASNLVDCFSFSSTRAAVKQTGETGAKPLVLHSGSNPIEAFIGKKPLQLCDLTPL